MTEYPLVLFNFRPYNGRTMALELIAEKDAIAEYQIVKHEIYQVPETSTVVWSYVLANGVVATGIANGPALLEVNVNLAKEAAFTNIKEALSRIIANRGFTHNPIVKATSMVVVEGRGVPCL